MQLSDWLDRNKVTRTEFAARIGVTPQSITGWCDGTFWINRENAQKIFDLTGGAVTPTDLMQTPRQDATPEAAQ